MSFQSSIVKENKTDFKKENNNENSEVVNVRINELYLCVKKGC